MKVRVLVRPKEGILDPQGQAVQRALPALGFQDVGTVHVGRLIELEIDRDGADQATVKSEVVRMCEQLLANPLIESYEVEVIG